MTRPLPITYEEAERVHQTVLEHGLRSVLFTSALPDEGTSTVAYALAQRLAAGGRRVLLVDFNAASSYAENVLALERSVWSIGAAGTTAIPFAVPGSGLAILPAPIGGFGEIACRDEAAMRRALEGWLREFDLVIGDAPALAPRDRGGAPTDLLARVFDGVIMVLLSDATPGNAAQAAVRRLRDAQARILGVVMNDREMPPLRDELARQVRKLGRRAEPLARLFESALGRLGLMSVDV